MSHLLPFCSCSAVMQKQMRVREARTWMLRDLLGLAGELPTFADPSQDEDTWYTPIYKIQYPTLVCSKKPRRMDLEAKTGLPFFYVARRNSGPVARDSGSVLW